jgi:hypothetical protein
MPARFASAISNFLSICTTRGSVGTARELAVASSDSRARPTIKNSSDPRPKCARVAVRQRPQIIARRPVKCQLSLRHEFAALFEMHQINRFHQWHNACFPNGTGKEGPRVLLRVTAERRD